MRFPIWQNASTGDAVTLAMDHGGPITPGDYAFANATSTPGPEDSPGLFWGGFTIGAGNPMSDGRAQAFDIQFGTVTLTAVSGGLLQGHVVAFGWRNREAVPIGVEPWGLEYATVQLAFSVKAKVPLGTPYSPEPYACLQRSLSTAGGGPAPSAPPARARPGAGATPAAPPVPPPPADRPGEAGGRPNTPAPATPPATVPGGAGGIPSTSGTGLAPVGNSLRLTTSGGVQTTVTMSGGGVSLVGGCSGTSPLSIGLQQGALQGQDWESFAFDTIDVVGPAATGVFPLREIRWDHGTVVPANLPPGGTSGCRIGSQVQAHLR